MRKSCRTSPPSTTSRRWSRPWPDIASTRPPRRRLRPGLAGGALLHTLALLKPLPSANARFACATAVAYMFVSDAGIDPPYGALVDLARDLISGKTDVYGAADRLRSWQI